MRAYTSCHEIAISSNPVTAVMPDITKYCFGVAVICSFIINLLCAQRQRSGDAPLVARTQQRLVLHLVISFPGFE